MEGNLTGEVPNENCCKLLLLNRIKLIFQRDLPRPGCLYRFIVVVWSFGAPIEKLAFVVVDLIFISFLFLFVVYSHLPLIQRQREFFLATRGTVLISNLQMNISV